MIFSFPLHVSPFVMARCAANSVPLSVVMVFTRALYGNNNQIAAFAVCRTFRSCLNFSMRMKLVECSVRVSMACPYASMMVSIFQFPKRLLSAYAGRSWTLVRLAILLALVGGCRLARFLYFNSCGICSANFPAVSS